MAIFFLNLFAVLFNCSYVPSKLHWLIHKKIYQLNKYVDKQKDETAAQFEYRRETR